MAEKETLNKFKLTGEQKLLARSIWENDLTCACGPAGTGKTLTTLQTFLTLRAHKHLEKIVIIRLIADTFDEHLGALPGDKDEKLIHFLGPAMDNLEQLMKPGELEYDLAKKKLEVIPVSHVRGRTFIRCGVLIDEAQNLSDEMILTIATRIGEGSRFVFCGDPMQRDFRHRNGLAYAIRLLDGLEGTEVVYLSTASVCRHAVIPAILERAESLREQDKSEHLTVNN